MTVTLELTPEEATALTACASTEGVDVEAILRRLIAPLVTQAGLGGLSGLAETGQSVLTPLLRPVAGADDLEEREERAREAAEMQNNIRRWRAEQARGTP